MDAKSLKETVRIYRQIQGKLADLAMATREVYEDIDQSDGSSEYSELHKDFCRDLYMTAKTCEKLIDRHQSNIQECEFDLGIEDRDCWENEDWPEFGQRYENGRLAG